MKGGVYRMLTNQQRVIQKTNIVPAKYSFRVYTIVTKSPLHDITSGSGDPFIFIKVVT